ncbi:predicted protein [Histoplasma mississippiense (nom. inval.)]|uniref:predicted protein n=1 Tax=Ajellomyces capsulatus (strain NAm1 / WU24) TaxID=2059318 RepID=UPI000157BBF7|nr:predicted protein [Histoplasma mississippiense (nom. inval.)]EDN05748.1 predicted protein [Histoplasma mississippiense (nom. inval.)]
MASVKSLDVQSVQVCKSESESALSFYICERIQGVASTEYEKQSATRNTTISNVNDVLMEDPKKHAPFAHPKNPEISIFTT